MADLETQYARDIISGKIPACQFVRQSCERHLYDLATCKDRGFYFDPVYAQHAVDFAKYCRHSKGRWRGQVLELQPWQKFITWCVFGWKKESDGKRRFRTAYVEVPRKNGKSTDAARIGLYLLDGEGEGGSEVYAAATKKDQAKIVWEEARKMVGKSPMLRRRITPRRNVLLVESTDSKFEPLGADSDTLDGLNVHAAIIDELHAHKDRRVWEALDSGTGSREQPLIWIITTAGFDDDPESLYDEMRGNCSEILRDFQAPDGIHDDSRFCFISTLDEGDDWRDEASWAKANPNYGVSVLPDDMRALCKTAINSQASQPNFLIKRLNVRTKSTARWMDLGQWDACRERIPWDEMPKGPAAGVDLAAIDDLTSLVLAWEVQGNTYVRPFFWLPEAAIDRFETRRPFYEQWRNEGLLTVLDGEVIDPEIVLADMVRICKQHGVREVAFDPAGSTSYTAGMEKAGIEPLTVKQTHDEMHDPMSEIGRRVKGGKFKHDGHAVLRWCVGNTECDLDQYQRIKPHRRNVRTQKIDGTVAMVLAMGRLMRHRPKDSVYNRRGVIAL